MILKKHVILMLVAIMVIGIGTVSMAENETPEPPSLTLNTENANLAKGKTLKLTVAAVGDGVPKKPTYKWQSSDKKIATVSGGTVTGVNGGKAVITVTMKLDEETELIATCEITVYVAITGLSSKEKSLTINVGASIKPSVTISPKAATNQNLLWQSNNEKIATVDAKGAIKGVGPGDCIVTATSQDGTNKTIKFNVFVPSLSTSTKEVVLDNSKGYFGYETVRVKYHTARSNITMDDKNASNNWYFEEFKDGTLTIRIWPWAKGTSTLTITDVKSPKSTLKIKITTTEDAAINSRRAFQTMDKSIYQYFMRYGVKSNDIDMFYGLVRVFQVGYNSENAWALGYLGNGNDQLVYITYPTTKESKHNWLQGETIRMQKDDKLAILFKPTKIYSYETTGGSTNYALQLKPMLITFDDGNLLYLDKGIYY